ncbi:hypothetical protein FF1_013359 [Malus domestica]
MDVHVGFLSSYSNRVPPQYVKVREHLLIELLLLLEEGAVEAVSCKIIEEFEAIEDLDRAALMDPNNAIEDSRTRGEGRRGG